MRCTLTAPHERRFQCFRCARRTKEVHGTQAGPILFTVLSAECIPEVVANKLHRWLLAGSVLELLVAVPTHVVVRRREECCAGMATGLGICIGIGVMIVAFGPSVALLYYRRWKQITPKNGTPRRHGDTEEVPSLDTAPQNTPL